MELNTKAMYFTMDALFAALIIVSGFIFINQVIVDTEPENQLEFVSQDLLLALDQIPITALNHSFITTEIANGWITNPENTILEQIAAYWATNQSGKAQTLASITLDQLLPSKYGVRLSMRPDLLFERSNAPRGSVIAGRRMISGIEKGQALEGSSSVGYLRSIHDKKSSAYAYFGGFVGQGNITVQLESLPSDVNSSRILDIVFEADLARDLSVYINQIHCADLSSASENLTTKSWSLSYCNSSLSSGVNNFTLTYAGLNNAYVGGGFFRVDYETDSFYNNRSYELKKYFFPEIVGIINLYDGFVIDGELNELSAYLHYHANHSNTSNPFYFTIGEQTVYYDSISEEPVTTTVDNLLLSALLNYSLLSYGTVPIRVGFENLTYTKVYTGNADVVVITDMSGSMAYNFTHDQNGVARNCDNTHIYDQSTQRLSVAKCLDKEFSENILNVTGNRIGLVSYSTDDSDTDSLPLGVDLTAIYNEIGMGVGSPTGYQASGYTCICCGINEAYRILSENLNYSTLISPGDVWYYWNESLDGTIPLDSQSHFWYELNYDISAWHQGPAVLGHEGGATGVGVDTEMGGNIPSFSSSLLVGVNDKLLDLWELVVDRDSPELDFTSGLNYTANTYGIGAGFDGWDWSGGTFDFAGSFTNFAVSGGFLSMRSSTSSDSSGAFAVTVNVTQEEFDVIASTGSANLSFFYTWDDRYGNYFESGDQVWVKGRWESPFSGSHYLGAQKDSTHDGGDIGFEIAAEDNPDNDIYNAFFTQNIASWIEGPGVYYLEVGGKVNRNVNDEYGDFEFDNFVLVARNTSFKYKNYELVDLWELTSDRASLEVDFTSGLNSSANTYGIADENDGWDWSGGIFDYATPMSFIGVYNGRLRMDAPSTGTSPSSGAYAVSVNITQEMYDILSNNGTAKLSFSYEWDDYGNYFEDDDEVWFKSRWTSPYSGAHYLGEQLDAGHLGEDSSFEIANKENPSVDFSGYFGQDVSSFIEGPGLYYLEVGGKLLRSASNEYGEFYMDDFLMVVTNITDHYYLRNTFISTQSNPIGRGVVNVLADDVVTMYVNGRILLDNGYVYDGVYWDIHGLNIPNSYFVTGTNLIAVEVKNSDKSARFDLELIGINDSHEKTMLVMSDGQANRECGEQGITDDLDGDGDSDTASDDAIQAACDAASLIGAKIYSVGYSSESDEVVLQKISECGNGEYMTSDNPTLVNVFYQDVALQILEAVRQSQSLLISGEDGNIFSTLYSDSYILINQTVATGAPSVNEIELFFQTEPFGACTKSVDIPQSFRVSDAKVTSYSGDHWTSLVKVDDVVVYNLSDYNTNFTTLGDPFIISIPPNLLHSGIHNITVLTGDDAFNTTGCSMNNTLIYSGFVNSSTSRSSVVELAEGCTWTVEFEDGGTEIFKIPSSYSGAKSCSYTSTSIVYDNRDAYDVAVHSLLQQLDFDSDGRLLVNLAAEDLEIVVILVSDVPYLWGPAIVEVELWQ